MTYLSYHTILLICFDCSQQNFSDFFMALNHFIIVRIKHILSCFESTESSNKQMLMFCKHGRVVNRGTKSSNELCYMCFGPVAALDCICNAVIVEVSVLDWSRVAVMVREFPVSFSSFELLIWDVGKLNFLGWNN